VNIVAVMATCGRHQLCERSLRFFLDQDYAGRHALLIYNNSIVPQTAAVYAAHFGPNKSVAVVNQHLDSRTGEPYTNLGAIYNDALQHIDPAADLIVHWDDDDIFLPNHLSEGHRGMIDALARGKAAYKPARSFYRHSRGVELASNTLEPSIFVLASHVRKWGYGLETTAQHLQWVRPLVHEDNILVDDAGAPTLIYNWGDTDIPTFKTSGNAGDLDNFYRYRTFSQDHGDQLIAPWPRAEVQRYYRLVE
jgi:hypothetical protein